MIDNDEVFIRYIDDVDFQNNVYEKKSHQSSNLI